MKLGTLGLWAILATSAVSQVAFAQQVPMEVSPREASSARVMELSEFIALLVPVKGMEEMGWDHLVDGPVAWATDGVEMEKDTSTRKGFVRLTIDGRKPKVLRQKYEEQAWTLEFSTSDLVKWGPKSMRLQVECFGALRRDCEFTMNDVRRNPAMSVQLLCSTRESQINEVYRLTVKGKKPVLMVYGWDGGSGGGTAWLEFRALSEQGRLCSDGK